MLTSDVKRRIDAARDVLVGVAPNPTTQIEQITFALIYKFMHDMDQSAVKAGGEASFFTGTLKKYSWDKVLDSRLGNHEKLALYSEALEKFTEAKQLPELFRSIFRSAYLPYKSPETLGLFLKEMNHFDYTHPEELGNAYEYLLSIMSSQGDAGQFRTPRHIIDFMVDVINPSKDDRILDPACGTGGFLISSYKHILEQHDGKNDPKKKEKPLTPDDRKKLMANLEGYDIDPTMVRIAQVNMYLHQFKNPQIFQYDTLTSEERWNDKYDVILANPPFMSPRGGIRPHNKFGVASNRAEVLFVDYIINHLKPKGRAGIIVPEGIIFQGGVAYKALRKNLVENGLYAVVSLPGGVFQPYSGVKTSILLFDMDFSKQIQEIAFLKISADGFDLGSTKRMVTQNDLPQALKILEEWKNGRPKSDAILTLITKSEIASKGEYSLSAERYKVATDFLNSGWDIKTLSELEDSGVLELGRGQIISKTDLLETPGIYPVYSSSAQGIGEFGQYGKYLFDEEMITWSVDGGGRFFYRPMHKFSVTNVSGWLRIQNKELLNAKYLFYVLENQWKTKDFNYVSKAHPSVIRDIYRIPIPPMEIQQQIVSELDGFTAIIAGAKQIVDNWKPTIDAASDFKLVELNSFCTIQNGYAFSSTDMGEFQEGYLPVIKIGNVGADGEIDTKCKYHAYSKKLDSFVLEKGDVLIAMTGATVGKVASISSGKFLLNQRVGKVNLCSTEVTLDYVRLSLQSPKFYAYCQATATGGAQGNISADEILKFKIPLAPLAIQTQLTSRVQEEKVQIDSLKTLVAIYESRCQEVIARLWDAEGEVH